MNQINALHPIVTLPQIHNFIHYKSLQKYDKLNVMKNCYQTSNKKVGGVSIEFIGRQQVMGEN